LAGCRRIADWRDHWSRWSETVAAWAIPVAVAYADPFHCQAPEVPGVIDLALQAGTRFLLIDTFRKDGRNLLDYLTVSDLERMLRPLRRQQTTVAVAGSLRFRTLPQIMRLKPDIIAMRGAICRGNQRTSSPCPQRLAAWQAWRRNLIRDRELPMHDFCEKLPRK
jgi:uncharacterized protein (UPF0264 family)